MSTEYDLYLEQHRKAVRDGLRWISEKLPNLLINNDIWSYEWQISNGHDASKNTQDEYNAYDAYFYGGERTPDVKKNFDYAWLHHIHNNKHHWQYWVLMNDTDGTYALDMPYPYIIEMICDWWAFSWSKGDLYEIFSWYDENKPNMILSKNTQQIVEEILKMIKEKLDEEGEADV